MSRKNSIVDLVSDYLRTHEFPPAGMKFGPARCGQNRCRVAHARAESVAYEIAAGGMHPPWKGVKIVYKRPCEPNDWPERRDFRAISDG